MQGSVSAHIIPRSHPVDPVNLVKKKTRLVNRPISCPHSFTRVGVDRMQFAICAFGRTHLC